MILSTHHAPPCRAWLCLLNTLLVLSFVGEEGRYQVSLKPSFEQADLDLAPWALLTGQVLQPQPTWCRLLNLLIMTYMYGEA